MERAQEMAAQYGGKVYNSFYELVDDPNVDAVSICVENRSHAEICTAALYAGKHVLVEKPMAVTLAECESMVAAAERNGKHLMIGHNMRFDPVHRRAKQLLDRGVIGDVITFRAVLGNAGPEGWSVDEGTWFFDKNKAALGALSDMGIEVDEVRAFGGGSKSPAWNQIKADILQKTICVTNSKEAACLGAAILAGHAVGIFDSIEKACDSMIEIVARYEPNPANKEVYDKGYEVYKRMQTDCAGLFDMISKR